MDIRQFAAIALLAAAPAVLADATAPLVVHEWGTFTSVQGNDGVQVAWNPLIETDLPDFVYSTSTNNGGFRGVVLVDMARKGDSSGILRMETPVIYFYSEIERSVNVRVSFPTGRITEWYPQANIVGPYANANLQTRNDRSLIEWNKVRVLARETQEIQPQALLRDREDIHARHYYAARATDASLLRVNAPYARSKVEYERDLFYRGIGYRPAPLIVKADDRGRSLSLSVATRDPVPAAFIISVDRSLMRYQKLGPLSPKIEHTIELDVEPFDALINVRGRLMKDVASTLMEQGLFAKEALAMVDTWKDQWFEEQGTRVLYVLPPEWTDETLPLEISPRPDTIVRVMIGRAEVITPDVTRELQRQILVFNSGAEDERRKAVATVADLDLGRFLEPATTIALGKRASGAIYQAASELKMQVNQIQAEERLAKSAALPE
jgi:hypothetical protein